MPAGGGPAIRLSGPLIPDGDVQTFSVTDDGEYVVYIADEQTVGVQMLPHLPQAFDCQERVFAKGPGADGAIACQRQLNEVEVFFRRL